MGQHAELSPSSAKRWTTCPASVQRSRGMPNRSNDYADQGTAAHFLAARCLQDRTSPSDYLGLTIGLYYHPESDSSFEEFVEVFGERMETNADAALCTCTNEFEVDDDMVHYVGLYVDYVNEQVALTKGELFVEQAVPIGHLTGEKDAEGTSDAVILSPDGELIVIDLKYGMTWVDPQNNLQLIMYALGAVKKFGLAFEPKQVRTVIAQPRVNDTPGEYTYTIEKILKYEGTLREAAAKARYAEPPAHASAEACKYCPAKLLMNNGDGCPEYQNMVNTALGAKFEDLTAEFVNEVKTVDLSMLNLKMLKVDIVEDWCKAVRAETEAQLLSGAEMEDFKLVMGRKGQRKWTDADEVVGVLKAAKLKEDDIYSKKVNSPAQIEKKVKKAKPKVWETLEEKITQSEGSPSVAYKSDPRPVYSPKPVEFDDLTQESGQDFSSLL